MAEYTAATIVKVLRNVPLDSTYSDTIYFESIGAQTSYFEGKAKYTFGPTSYQRVNSSIASPRGPRSIRLPRVADDFYDCNYVMFQNASFGTKWFYGFITSVNYINPDNTEILYELDYYQTYAFDFRILPSFIEREHSVTDELYHNLMPETLGNPEVIKVSSIHKTYNQYYITVLYNADSEKQPVQGQIAGNVYMGCASYTVPIEQYQSVNDFISQYDEAGRSNAIIAIFMSPFQTTLPDFNFERIDVERPVALNGYVPRNQKLLTYPYCFLRTSDRMGRTIDFKYENFASYSDEFDYAQPKSISFAIYAIPSPIPSLTLVPYYYGSENTVLDPGDNAEYSLEVSGFPTALWTNNDYANYMATTYQNGVTKNLVNTIWGVLGGLATTITGAAQVYVTGGATGWGRVAGGIAGTATALMSGKANSAALAIDAATKAQNPGSTSGSLSSNNPTWVTHDVGFTIYNMAIKPEMARMIDSYFDMYGYATNQVKMPNFTSRESWNYVKTADVMMDGSMPVEAMDTIKTIFNNGIRFWHGDYVGDYTRSNRCIADLQKAGENNA